MSQINAMIRTATISHEPTSFVVFGFRFLASRYFVVCLLVTLAVAVDWIWIKAAGFRFSVDELAAHGPTIAFLAIASGVFGLLSRTNRYAAISKTFRLPDMSLALGWFVLILIWTDAMLVLQYLCITLRAPLVDAQVVALDKVFGFRWTDLFRWHTQHPQLTAALGFVYQTFVPQVGFTIFALGLTGRHEALAEFVLLFVTTAILVIVISAAFPASNPYFYFNVIARDAGSPWSFFYPLRDGSMTTLTLGNPQGLISIPSMHALDAVLFVYAVRHLKLLFPVSAALNAVMIYSAIVCGAHYLVDILAGVLVALFAIGFSWRRNLRWTARASWATP